RSCKRPAAMFSGRFEPGIRPPPGNQVRRATLTLIGAPHTEFKSDSPKKTPGKRAKTLSGTRVICGARPAQAFSQAPNSPSTSLEPTLSSGLGALAYACLQVLGTLGDVAGRVRIRLNHVCLRLLLC